MPVYEYEIPEAGATVTIRRPVHRRDDPVHVRRRTVPRSMAIRGAAADPLDFETKQALAWKRLEEKGKIPRNLEWSKETVKRTLKPPR